MRIIDEHALEDIALGAVILGSGGGGNPYIGKLMAREAIRRYGPARLVTLDELDDDDLVAPSVMMGAPAVMVEKVASGDDAVAALQALGRYLGRPVKATMAAEAGGINTVVPIYAAARLGIPIVDCDGTGRAFPEVQMTTFTIHGMSATPFAMADTLGNSLIIDTIDNRWAETFARGATVSMGAVAMVSAYPATVSQLKVAAVHGTMTRAQAIGEAIRTARDHEGSPVDTVRRAIGGTLLFEGTVEDVERRTERGFSTGDAFVMGANDYADKRLQLSFQNEHLAARIDNVYVVTVPDLINVLDLDTGQPITAEALRHGFRVAVIGMPCVAEWRTPAGLELVGPRYFGYDVDYVPIEQRYPPEVR